MGELTQTQLLLMGFVTLIIGIMLIGVVATSTNNITSKTAATDQALSIASARNKSDGGSINSSVVFTIYDQLAWKQSDCPITSVLIENNSGYDLVDNTDYALTESTGKVFFYSTPAVNGTGSNSTTVDYSYCSDDYINSSWGRTSMNTIVGFFALVLMIVSVGIFYKVASDGGILNF